MTNNEKTYYVVATIGRLEIRTVDAENFSQALHSARNLTDVKHVTAIYDNEASAQEVLEADL